jgi:hypothetical protein
MRAVQITRFGGPEVLELVDVPEPEAGPGQQLYDVDRGSELRRHAPPAVIRARSAR